MDVSRRSIWPALLLVLAVLAARLCYLICFSTWELVGDEAHYWEWSRRPDLSYYTKGPGISWVIWLSKTLLGNNAAAVRIPSAFAAAVMASAGAGLAFSTTKGSARAAVFAVIALSLAPGYFAIAQLATTDVFYSTTWIVAVCFMWHALTGKTSTRRLVSWSLVGVAIGVGCLFKYTALFQIVGFAAVVAVERRHIVRDRTFLVGVLLATLMIAAACSPMLH